MADFVGPNDFEDAEDKEIDFGYGDDLSEQDWAEQTEDDD